MRHFFAIIITCFLCIPSVAQEEPAPKSLVGFLKPGMHVGITSFFPESERITIQIYDEQDHLIAIDAKKLTLEELSAKYEKVASQLERTRKEIFASLKSDPLQIPPGKEYGEPSIGLRINQRESLCKILATGDDYILVTSAASPSKRRVIATRFVSSITWNEELPLTWSVPHVDKATDKPKP